jgi:hypothetical protein
MKNHDSCSDSSTFSKPRQAYKDWRHSKQECGDEIWKWERMLASDVGSSRRSRYDGRRHEIEERKCTTDESDRLCRAVDSEISIRGTTCLIAKRSHTGMCSWSHF